MIEWAHPGAILIIGAALVPFLKGRIKQTYLLILPVLAFAAIVSAAPGTHGVVHLLNQKLVFGRVDRLSLVFGYIFAIMAFIGVIYGMHVKRDGEYIAALLYVGGSMGAVFAGDFITLFIFWELMAFASLFLIWFKGDKASDEAGYRYILVHIFGGVCLLGGIILYYANTGSIEFNAIKTGGPAFYMILAGFLINAAVPPFSAWLADAYPEATIMGAVFMCAFTTKTAVYVLIRGFAGTELLIWMGVIMAVYGVVYATLENDGRRLLAYHIISQVGYMVAGIGIGTELALNGSTAHAFAHILYKGLLFMGVGAVMQMTGKRKLTDLGGIYKTMPITMILYMVGAFSISAFPLFSGFVSKSMVISAAEESHIGWAVLLLTSASSGTFISLGLKLPYYMFFGEDSGIRTKEPPLNMLVGMGIAAFLCIAIGVWPGALYSVLPFPVDYAPYTAQHVVTALGILLFTALGFFLLLKRIHPEPSRSLDTDWFYRKGARLFLKFAERPVATVDAFVGELHTTMALGPAKRLASVSLSFDIGIIDALVNLAGWLTRFAAWVAHKFDVYVVDGLVNSAATLVSVNAGAWRRLQTGQIQNYALIMVLGLVVIIGGILLGIRP
ncbi:MAG: Na(+)/H(+) antiporter subunit D [Deltaproteobacteria bacterium]|nr:Na(+)/H(+) antiporter subunit D [Deltaproteobacteria bacterium]